MNELPDSRKEKNEYSDKHMNKAGFKFPRWLYVHELKSLLDELKPDDWVTPNQVGNLLVERDIDGKSKSIGSIDFHFNELEYFDGEDEKTENEEFVWDSEKAFQQWYEAWAEFRNAIYEQIEPIMRKLAEILGGLDKD